MTAIPPVKLLTEILASYDIHTSIEKSAMSSIGYVYVSKVGGFTPHINLSYRPLVQVIVYSSLGSDEAERLSYQIQSDLRNAIGKPYPSGGLHRIITVTEPYEQQLPGLIPGASRFVGQYELILSTKEKWA